MNTRRARILLIDAPANTLWRSLHAALAHHKVETARDAIDAIYRIDCIGRPYDVIFCDLAGDLPGPELWAYLSLTRKSAASRMVFVASGPLKPETKPSSRGCPTPASSCPSTRMRSTCLRLVAPHLSQMLHRRNLDINIGIDAKNREQIALALSKVQADTYTLYLKTHNFHWNVTGPMFQTLHLMFEQQYNELWLAGGSCCGANPRARISSAGHVQAARFTLVDQG